MQWNRSRIICFFKYNMRIKDETISLSVFIPNNDFSS